MSARRALVLDFGTSRIKGAFADLHSGGLTPAVEGPSPPSQRGGAGEVEADPFLLRDAFIRIVEDIVEGDAPPSALWLCSEMHGFVLDDGQGTPLTPYIGWRDERASRDGPPSTLQLLEDALGQSFQQVTGMKARPGIPAVVLTHLSRSGRLPRNARFLSLPEWLVASAGEFRGLTHPTIAAASGLYDVEQRGWSEMLLRRSGAGPARLRLSAIMPPGESLGPGLSGNGGPFSLAPYCPP